MAKSKSVIQETEAKFGYVKGTAKWAKVLEAGQFGSFTIDMYGPDVEEMFTEMEALRDSGAKEVDEAGKKYQVVDVFKENEETGQKYIQFKLPEMGYDDKVNKVKIFDVSGTEVTDTWDKLIGNGSTVKVKYMAKPYYMASTKNVGISYKFYAVQIIKLEEYSGGGESGFGDETSGDGPIDASEEF